MKKNSTLIIKLLELISIILLYYIVGKKSIFLYVISLSLYNVFIPCFNHIKFNKTSNAKTLKIIISIITLISILFLILSIVISDILSITLNIKDSILVFIFMGLSIIAKPLIRVLSNYLEVVKNNPKIHKLVYLYDVLDIILLLIIAIFSFRIFNLNNNISNALLYLSKILSCLIICMFLYLTNINIFKVKNDNESNIRTSKEIKQILVNNSHKSIITAIKNSYFYISIIVLYLVLSTRYNYEIKEIESTITFIYYYLFMIISYIIYLTAYFDDNYQKNTPLTLRIFNTFKIMLTLAIILGILSPLICKVIFNNPDISIYFTMLLYMAIFIALYDITYKNLHHKLLTYISLIVGILLKLIIVIPLINSFYRMGYNLIYGDIISTIIAMFTSIAINYVHLRKNKESNELYFEKVLKILYENILLCIVLIIVEFIIPIDTTNYFKSMALIFIYMLISLIFIKLKFRKKRRGK